jgi:hypothetical protein
VPLSPITRNQYPQLDRAEAQDRIAYAIEADPAPFFNQYKANPASHDGRYICSDLFKETFPEFAASREGRARFNNPLHNSAAVLAAEQLTRILSDPSTPERDTVVFLIGVPGAGKTSAVIHAGKLPSNTRAIFEGQLANPQASIDKIQQVLDAGFRPAVLVIHIAPEFALQNTLSRFEREGRGASIHAMANIQAQLPTGLMAIHERFGDEVQFDVFDRTAGLNNTVKRSGWHTLSTIEKEGDYDRIRERLTTALDLHNAAGILSDETYRQAAGLCPLDRSEQTVRADARRAQQLPNRGLEQDATAPVERRGALRFWQESAGNQTTKYAVGRLNAPGTDVFPRDLKQQRAVSRGTGYDAGHLIGHQFGGPEIPANLSLQNPTMNQGGGTWYMMESRWAESLAAGNAVSVAIREITRTDDPTFVYRNVEVVTTTPAGEITRESLAFLNPETERTLAIQGRVRETVPDGGKILDLRPLLKANREATLQTEVAVKLTDNQAKSLLAAQFPNDFRKQTAALQTVLSGDATVGVADGIAQLDYSEAKETFFAVIDKNDKPALDTRLNQLNKAVEGRRDAEGRRPQPSKVESKRDFERE